MRLTAILITLIAILSGRTLLRAEVPLNQLTEAEKRSGWKLLFDGKSADQFRNYKKKTLSDGWVIEDGAIVRKKSGAGDIITKQEFDSFDLQLEYRISKGGNSGLMFHVTEDNPAPWQSGPEVQIQDNVDGHDPQLAGWLYQLYKPNKPAWAKQFEAQVGLKSPDVDDATRPAGEWNQIYLRVTKEQCEVCLNGVSYYKFQIGSKDWDARVAKSKFAKYKGFGKAETGHICLQDHGNEVAFRNIKIRPLPNGKAKQPIDGAIAAKAELAFPDLEWEGWEPIDARGRPQELRPIQLTHASDGTNRIFVGQQSGMIHVLPNDRHAKTAKLYLDISKQTHDWQRDNEEGFLGLAFHPKYKQNGRFYVYYTAEAELHTSYISRFNVSANDPDKADPESEEVVMKIKEPFANHNGGSIAFGPDGYLYIALGDGGSRNDPFGNGQKLDTWMGKILRIDVDRKENGMNYAVPSDNPFVGKANAKPEIFAYGFRNIWRIGFDAKTGDLWLGDVGQDLWEEIDVVTKGGNYGWSVREGTQNFGNAPGASDVECIDPVWEYDHQIGKSITGGVVYRGKSAPALAGCYLYGDYVTGKLWALKYDRSTGKVLFNKSVGWNGQPILSFGEDETGEAYVTMPSSGKGIYRFVSE